MRGSPPVILHSYAVARYFLFAFWHLPFDTWSMATRTDPLTALHSVRMKAAESTNETGGQEGRKHRKAIATSAYSVYCFIHSFTHPMYKGATKQPVDSISSE